MQFTDIFVRHQGPLSLTRINFNPIVDEVSRAQ